jgi:hypothetical protein
MPDSFPPGKGDKSFFVFGDAPHCTTKTRPFASIDAGFGNVYEPIISLDRISIPDL